MVADDRRRAPEPGAVSGPGAAARHRGPTSRPPGVRWSRTCAWSRSAGRDDGGLVYLSTEPCRRRAGRRRLGSADRHRRHRRPGGPGLEAHLISPWGTWEWIGPAALGAVLPARGTVELGFDVTPPAWLEPGQWWALVRVGCAGRLVYSPAVKVTVT